MAYENFKWPERFNVVSWFGVGVDVSRSWGEIMTRDTGMKVRVGGEFDTVNRFRWVGPLEVFDMTGGSPGETSQMLMGDRKYATRDGGPFPLRVVWTHSRGNSGFFTRKGSPIKVPQDIKPGTKVCDMLPYVAATRVFDGLLAWAGVSRDDIEWVPVHSSVENWQAVIDGRAELSFSFPTSPTQWDAYNTETSTDWIDLNAEKDPDGAKRFREWDPLVNFGEILPVGVPSAKGKWGTAGINLEITRAGVDPALVYNVAKWFNENYARYTEGHPENQYRTLETLLEGLKHTYMPCHEGLITYLKELGVWTPAHDKRQAENIALVDRYIAEYDKVMTMADAKSVWVSPESPEWVEMWNDYKAKNIPPFILFEDLPD
jgi:hypothetical protein